MVKRKILFISDLHLEENRPDITQKFMQLLIEAQDADALYILGDLFEAWIGDDENTKLQNEVTTALKKLAGHGTKIYFLHGNRDFFIGKKFLRESNASMLSEESKVSLFGTPVLLMHGDTLCTLDKSYLKARKIAHSWLFKFCFLLLPLKWRAKVRDNMRAKSQSQMKTKSAATMDVTTEAVIDVMKKHNVKFLIHGHTHKPGIHHFSIDDQPAIRIVLDAWHDHGNVLIWDDAGQFVLKDF